MGRAIYLLQHGDQLVELREQPYNSEDLLQHLLASHPSLLAGEQIDRVSPRRWILVAREMGVPGEDGGGTRWSIDHLFLDQDAIPTLVEVKRSSDPRIRREVIGQMLDYAANAILYWPIEHLREQFERTCQSRGTDADRELAAVLGPEADPAAFWQQAKTNLQAGRIRLVFVADEIPSELQRIVEFLNQQMDPAEVLALEIRQYAGQGVRSLVPNVLGQTAESERRKDKLRADKRKWDESSFFQHLAEQCSPAEVAVARRLLEWARGRATYIWWGRGQQAGSLVPVLTHQQIDYQLFSLWSSGTFEFYFYWLARKPPFNDEIRRLELLKRLNAVEGVSLPREAINRRPNIPLATFADERQLQQLLTALSWMIEQITSADLEQP